MTFFFFVCVRACRVTPPLCMFPSSAAAALNRRPVLHWRGFSALPPRSITALQIKSMRISYHHLVQIMAAMFRTLLSPKFRKAADSPHHQHQHHDDSAMQHTDVSPSRPPTHHTDISPSRPATHLTDVCVSLRLTNVWVSLRLIDVWVSLHLIDVCVSLRLTDVYVSLRLIAIYIPRRLTDVFL